MWDVSCFITVCFITSIVAHLYQSRISLSHPAQDAVAEVPVMYRVVHPAGDRWGESLVQGGGAVWVCFQGKGEISVGQVICYDSPPFDLLGILVTNNLHAVAPATR